MARKRKLFNPKEFLARSDIKEGILYLVNVSYGAGNPIHPCYLFIGYKSGAYCKLYTNNYDGPNDLWDVYYLELVKELGLIPRITECKLPPRLMDPQPLGSDW